LVVTALAVHVIAIYDDKYIMKRPKGH